MQTNLLGRKCHCHKIWTESIDALLSKESADYDLKLLFSELPKFKNPFLAPLIKKEFLDNRKKELLAIHICEIVIVDGDYVTVNEIQTGKLHKVLLTDIILIN